MQQALQNKPEITPPAVVNSRTGFTTAATNSTGQSADVSTSATSTPAPSSPSNASTPRAAHKRKAAGDKESPATKRHLEAMEFRRTAHAQFMELMGKLIDKL